MAKLFEKKRRKKLLSVRTILVIILLIAFLGISSVISILWRVNLSNLDGSGSLKKAVNADTSLVDTFPPKPLAAGKEEGTTLQSDKSPANNSQEEEPTQGAMRHAKSNTPELKRTYLLKSDRKKQTGIGRVGGGKKANNQPRPLPDHCSAPKIGELVFKGERHSGTNFVKQILLENTWRDSSDVGGNSIQYGWKHGYLPPLGGKGQPFNGAKDTLIIITRDVFTWLPKMMEESYDPVMNKKRNDGFSAFIRAEYSNACPHDKRKDDTIICESASNLVQARTQKYRQWLSDDPDNTTYSGSKDSFLQSRFHVRLESVASVPGDDSSTKERQIKYIRDPLWERCVPVAGDKTFKEVSSHIAWYNRKTVKIDPNEEKNMMLGKYSKEDLRFVLSELDMAFEQMMGYDYGYVYDILNE